MPKPEPRKRVKARKDRAEAALIAVVRALCVLRDGYCRVALDINELRGLRPLGMCDGPSEWAHFHTHTRAKTRGMAPELRHMTSASLMLCRRHHRLYDGHGMTIDAPTAGGCNGLLRFERA